MASEVIKLNLIPKGETPVFHASQFDTGRLITCELYRGEDAYSVPEGYTVELHCRKVDNNIVTMASTLINDNVVTFTSTEQLTACNGKNLCEVAILDDGYRIGTLNFILEVEIDPLKGGINSTSEIHNLETQVEEITTEIIGENYYNKTETDALLDTKADASSVYTKTQVDSALALKANAADVYTKSQTDTLLSAKANSSDVYTKGHVDTALSAKADTTYVDAEVDVLEAAISAKADASSVYTKTQVDSALALKANAADVYTKQEVDNIIMDIMPVDTASGAIATFDTEIAAPLVNVSCNIVATGGYDADTQTAHPINGYTEANITRCGVNLCEEVWESGFIASSGVETPSVNSIRSKNYNPVMEGVSLYLYAPNVTTSSLIACYDADKNFLDYYSLQPGGRTITTPTGSAYFRISLYNYNRGIYDNAVSINYPSTDTTYHSYNGNTTTIAFGQTVYGGVLDVTRGKLKPCIEYPSYNGERLSGRWLSSEATYVEGTTPPTGSQVVSLDDYGSDIDLTTEVISAVVGTNNVYSDTNGDTTVQFKDSIQHYIDNH